MDTFQELKRIAAREIRKTPEYVEAKDEGRAREWLECESESAAYMLASSLEVRLGDLDA